MIDFNRYPFTHDPNGWGMDNYHVEAILRLITQEAPATIAEFGSFKGRSAIAYVEAQRQGLFPVVHLVDIKITDEVRQLIGMAPRPEKFILHQCATSDFRMMVDLAVIDADHSESGAGLDVGWATGWRIPWIVLHDVSGWPRNPGLYGSWKQGNELRRNPHYVASWHDDVKDGAACWRGLMVAGPEGFVI